MAGFPLPARAFFPRRLNVRPADAPALLAGAIIAVRQNGRPMSIRDKGPLWIVFPYDADPKLVTDDYLNRSVWQLRTLVGK